MQGEDDPLTDNFDQWEKFRDAASAAEDISEPAKLSGDHIVLATRWADEALAYSLGLVFSAICYAFAQSVKLAVFEKIVDSAIEKAKPIPEALAQHGTFDLDEKLVKMQMGAIFVTKCSMTLQSDMLGTPEILWEHDRFDVDILDQRLAVLNDLYSFLQTQLEATWKSRVKGLE
ncbi:Sad1-interacting factor 2 [Symbiodinium microadriaticum]|uniref:Sad1-interacting factor 2 n=1 Tax=Symbiodinium microadriaticum TaxID=2951 RepID=A0A1Q9CTM3_SYMMI|nr:Sad1-interacting factor 2 [Symbiodinium microadriaticum]